MRMQKLAKQLKLRMSRALEKRLKYGRENKES